MGFGTALALAAAGLWIYCDMHPEKVLEYWINRDREEVESFEAEKSGIRIQRSFRRQWSI